MKIAVLFRGNLRDSDRSIEKFSIVYQSIELMLGEECEIDFYMHLWGDEKEEEKYKKNFNFERIVVESNFKYHNIINNVSKIHGAYKNNEPYKQVSQALSISKVCDYITSPNNYDYCILTRPDLPYNKKINQLILNDNTIYVCKHGNYIKNGEYFYLFTPNNLSIFKNIFDFLKNEKLRPEIHSWFYTYLNNYCKKNIELLDFEVGVDFEIFKHLENLYPEIYNKILEFVNK